MTRLPIGTSILGVLTSRVSAREVMRDLRGVVRENSSDALVSRAFPFRLISHSHLRLLASHLSHRARASPLFATFPFFHPHMLLLSQFCSIIRSLH